jgi:hypothetical protein
MKTVGSQQQSSNKQQQQRAAKLHIPQQRNPSQYSKHVLPSLYKHKHLPKKLLLHEHNATTLQNLAHLVEVQNDSIIAGNIKMQKLALIKDSCC